MHRLLVVITAAVLTACASAPPPPAPAAIPAPVLKSGLDLSGFDRSVRPQDDLYRFVGGTWLAKTEIPADRSNYGSFIILDDQAQEEVKALIVAAAEQPNRAPGSDAQKVGDFYRSYMDTARIESLGLGPLREELARIDALATPRDVARYIGYSQRVGVSQPFAWFSTPDNKNSSVYIASTAQRGLTMPDRDYYLSPDAKYAEFRAKFAVYVERMLALAGVRDAHSAAARIAALETRLANYQWTKVQLRDPVKTYNPMSLPEYSQLAPGLDWIAFFEGLSAPVQKIDVSQPSFVKGVGRRLARLLQVPAARRLRAGTPRAVRRSRVRFPPAHAERRARAEAALAARRRHDGFHDGRARRQDVRRSAFRRRSEAPDARARRQPAEGFRQLHRRPRMDERGDARGSEDEAFQDHGEDRVSGSVA
jgi:hypothetical protein